MKTIKEENIEMANNETKTVKGVYQTEDGYMWVTLSRSGNCKTLATAMKKVGF